VPLSWQGEPFTPTHHHLLVELTLFSGRGKLNFVELVPPLLAVPSYL